jgi:hypothetical protein
MLEITLCCNMDIIPPWCVRKSALRFAHFEKNHIFACNGWYEFRMNRHINHSISRLTPFIKTCNEKYDVYEYTYVVFFLWGYYVVKLHEVRITKVLVVYLPFDTLVWTRDDNETRTRMCIENPSYENVDLRYPMWIVPCQWMECNYKSAEWYSEKHLEPDDL